MKRSRPSTAAASKTTSSCEYSQIIRSMLAPEYLESGLAWLKHIGDKEKQGLRIISAVIKNRGTKKFRNKPKETVTEAAQKAIGTKSHFNLTNEALEKYRNEYKQNIYKSAYGISFGRKETDFADTNILKYKNFNELPCTKVLNSTTKAFISKWSQLGEDSKYVSLAILVVKGIFTHWKQTLPSDTVSHLKHIWFDVHDHVHHQRMDQVGKTTLIGMIDNTVSNRPQTTASAVRRNHNALILSSNKEEEHKGIDDIIQNRK